MRLSPDLLIHSAQDAAVVTQRDVEVAQSLCQGAEDSEVVEYSWDSANPAESMRRGREALRAGLTKLAAGRPPTRQH